MIATRPRCLAQGIVFNEASAYGLPVVSTDVGGVSTVVRPDWGFLLPPESGPEPYAAWIKEAFTDRPRYQALATRAREEYDQRLSSAVYIQKLTHLIEAKGARS